MAFYFEKDFFEDAELLELVNSVMQGNLTLHWWDAKTERVRVAPSNPDRGLTYEDLNVGSYGYDSIPEFVRDRYSMAARGSEVWGKLPDLGYTVNRKSDVWSENVARLYEEAKSRRWAPAIDIPWSRLAESKRSRELEAAVAQLCTTLGEVALVGLEMPTRWVFWINQEFLELKSFLCSQMLDQARHLEVLRKRALAGGEGLKRASVPVEQALKEILFAEPYPAASAAMNLMLGSVLLTLYRFAAAVAPGAVENAMFRRMLQDKARHVAYGMGQVRYYLEQQPRQRQFLSETLDSLEHCVAGILGSPELTGSLTVYAGGGAEPEKLVTGRSRIKAFLELAVAEYLERRDRLDLRGAGRLRSTLHGVVAA